MTTFVEVAKRVEKLAIDHSPAILTAVAVTGTLGVAFLTGTATIKAVEIIADEQYRISKSANGNPPHILEPKEKIVLVWKEYIPAIGTVVATVVCIIGANRIGTRRAAAVAAAYSISEKAFTEYKEKVVEKIGQGKEQKIHDEVMQDQVRRNPVGDREVIITGNGEVLCFDSFSGRYFTSDMETLKKAQNDINYTMLSDGYASLGDFYDNIGLATTAYSDEVGWTSEKPLECKFTGTLSDDQRPCIAIEFRVAPVRDYHRIH
jgi:hypothetical protein